MVCVPSRGALFVGSGVPAVRFSVPSAHARGGSRGPRDVAAFPASSSGRGNFSAPPPVMAHSAAGGSLERGCRSPVSGSIPGPNPGATPVPRGSGSRARSPRICKTPACLSRCRVHSPASSVWLGKALRLSDRFAGRIPCPVPGARASPTVLVSSSRGQPVSTPGPCAMGSLRRRPRDGELPSDVPRKGNGVGRGGIVIDASGSSLAAGAGFPPLRWPDQLSSGKVGILRSLARVPFRKVWAPRPTLFLRFRPRVFVVGSVRRLGFCRYGIPVR
jgi:hypothetical protein